MPSVINSDNGAVSGTAGLKTSGASDGITAFQQNGTESVRIDASGNVGVGTTVPGSYSKFVVAADGNGQALLATSATGSINQAMYNQGGLVSAKYVYGNSYTGGSILNVGANGTAFVQLANAPLAISTQGVAQPILFGTNSTERARITSGGDLLVGATSNAAAKVRVTVGGSAAGVRVDGITGSNQDFYALRNGASTIQDGPNITLQSASGTTYATTMQMGPTGETLFFNYNGSAWNERARITSGGDLLVGATASTGSSSNNASVVGGIFSTFSGTYAGATSGSTVTLTAISTTNSAAYLVSVSISAPDAPANYTCVAILRTSGTGQNPSITNLTTATFATLSLSGSNLQYSQTSGITQTIKWTLLRLM